MSAREDENRRLLRAWDAIDRHHPRRLDVDELARIAVMSPAHFSRRFSALFGETLHRYLQRRRDGDVDGIDANVQGSVTVAVAVIDVVARASVPLPRPRHQPTAGR